jgi:hypothetical protein
LVKEAVGEMEDGVVVEVEVVTGVIQELGQQRKVIHFGM